RRPAPRSRAAEAGGHGAQPRRSRCAAPKPGGQLACAAHVGPPALPAVRLRLARMADKSHRQWLMGPSLVWCSSCAAFGTSRRRLLGGVPVLGNPATRTGRRPSGFSTRGGTR
ncbi:unnamed protein product, partial [Prorocentrum cordatum]